jgi:hypothetical protein
MRWTRRTEELMTLRERVLAPVLLLTACGGVTLVGGPGTDEAAMPPCSEYAQAYCAKRDACSNGELTTRDWGDMTTCLTRETLACTDSLGAPRTGQTKSLIEQCAAALPCLSCADVLDSNLPDVCNPSGPGPMGGPCTFNAQCASGFCSNARYATCGSCASPPAAKSSCAVSSCWHDQTCIWNEVVTNVCEAYVPTGSPCGAYGDPECEADLTCAGASVTTGVSGECQPAVGTSGATCGDENIGLGCDGTIGLWCTSSSTGGGSACSAVAYAGDGMPCGYLSSAVTECARGTCYSTGGPYFTFAGPSTGTCKALAADGAACNTSTGPECLSPARCVTSGGEGETAGVCTVPTASVSAMCH